MTVEDNRTAIQFKQPIPSFHPGPPTQLTPLRSQYDPYPVPEYGNYMVQHPNPYVEYPVGFDIYGNVSGPSLYLGHLVGNLASNNRYPLPLQSIHSGPGTEVHHHPGFPYDFGQRPAPQFYYPTPPNMLISPQIPQHLPVSPLMSGFDQQVCHNHGLSLFFRTEPRCRSRTLFRLQTLPLKTTFLTVALAPHVHI